MLTVKHNKSFNDKMFCAFVKDIYNLENKKDANKC